MAKRLIRRLASAVFFAVLLCALWLTPASSFPRTSSYMPQFQIYSKNGKPVDLLRMDQLYQPDNFLRFGFEVRPDLRIGVDSRYGFGVVYDF